MDPIDVVAIVAVALLAVGVAGQFTPFVALIVVGVLLLAYATAVSIASRRAEP